MVARAWPARAARGAPRAPPSRRRPCRRCASASCASSPRASRRPPPTERERADRLVLGACGPAAEVGERAVGVERDASAGPDPAVPRRRGRRSARPCNPGPPPTKRSRAAATGTSSRSKGSAALMCSRIALFDRGKSASETPCRRETRSRSRSRPRSAGRSRSSRPGRAPSPPRRARARRRGGSARGALGPLRSVMIETLRAVGQRAGQIAQLGARRPARDRQRAPRGPVRRPIAAAASAPVARRPARGPCHLGVSRSSTCAGAG